MDGEEPYALYAAHYGFAQADALDASPQVEAAAAYDPVGESGLYSAFDEDDEWGTTVAGQATPADGESAGAGSAPMAAARSLPPASGRDWSAEFAEVLTLPARTTEQRFAKAKAMHALVRMFTSESTRVARAIVEDLALPDSAKRVTPLAGAGGVAGGQKYRCGNVFFKFATHDAFGIYG